MNPKFHIHPEIEKAETLPSSFYLSDPVFEALKEKVFLESWQYLCNAEDIQNANEAIPINVLGDFLNESVILSKDTSNNLNCISNVCTHRANLILNEKVNTRELVCNYHGRRFGLDGKFKFMPEFKQAENFPMPCDDLHRFPLIQWGPMLFVGFSKSFDFQSVINTMKQRIGFLPIDDFVFDASRSKDYFVNAHWALYCDNYLEGFHIPFVHKDLNEALDYGKYTTKLYDNCNLQIGYADNDANTFDLPLGHPDYGKNVASYYYWVFPNMMFNFYPWGLSLNIVKPISKDLTKLSFLSYVWDESKIEGGAGEFLDRVEKEDEA
ncbi:MAG: aromatic ring-hydroxylating dioxygenase subunit alpha, partial [Saprospiraceae bacterium]|nr:aromatic ring-hydroxylating dioxygenase subunit alpha [Saprospiraceae bacterium]